MRQTESAWRRGWNDTKSAWSSWRFKLLEGVAAPVAAIVVGLIRSPAAGAVAAFVVVAGGLLLVWVVVSLRAPARQRDEARSSLARLVSEQQHQEASRPRVAMTPFVDAGIAQLRVEHDGNTTLRCQAQMKQMSPSPSKPERLPYSLKWKGQAEAVKDILPGATGVLEIARQVSTNKASSENVLVLLSAEGDDRRFTVTSGLGAGVEVEVEIASDPPVLNASVSYKIGIGSDGGIDSFLPSPGDLGNPDRSG